MLRVACLLAVGICCCWNTAIVRGADSKPANLAPANIELSVQQPKKAPTLAAVNSGDYALTLQIKNTSQDDIVVWPFVTLKLFDEQGKAVEHSQYIGRFGGRFGDKSILEEMPFKLLAPGKSEKIELQLNGYMSDPKFITGWKLPTAGKYKLQAHYQYDRAAVKKDLGEGCKNINNPTAPWNQAVEINQTLEIPLNVQ